MIRINSSFRADLEWWYVFVASWNGVSLLKERRSYEGIVEIWSDAFGFWGCGEFVVFNFHGSRCQSKWQWQYGGTCGQGQRCCVTVITCQLWQLLMVGIVAT